MSAAPATRRGILAGGNWIIDHFKLIDAWPAQDALANIVGQSWSGGGSPCNLLKDLARLRGGFPLAAVGLLGDDADGQRIIEDCRAHGIDTTQLRVTREAPTSFTDVMSVQSTGRRTFFHMRGANALLDRGHFDFTASAAKIFHLGYLLLLDRIDQPGVAPRLLADARAAGFKTSVDLVSEDSNRFQSVVLPALPHTDYLFANDFEAERLTGIMLGRGPALDRAAVERAGRALIAAGVREWAVIHFPEGACACSASGEIVWQASVHVPAAEIQGTAGAGDAFAAGVLVGLHETWPMVRSLELGVCAAASCLRLPTCSDAVLPVAECLALGTKWGFRA